MTADVTESARDALQGVRRVPLWLDPERVGGVGEGGTPTPRPPLDRDATVDLAIVGGGFTGLWAALLAAEEFPARSAVLLEAAQLGWAASGRNGGFCSASLTHGLVNGRARWPRQLPLLLRFGHGNLDQIETTIARHRIDCDFVRGGELDVAVAPWQVSELAELHRIGTDLGERMELLDRNQVRALVDSPTYLAGLLDRRGTAVLDPGKLVRGLAAAAERLGTAVHERTRVLGLADEGDRVRLTTTSGTVRARHVLLASGAFASPLRRVRPYVVPVWDHVLATEPLTAQQQASLGWRTDAGVADGGNQFHYYRRTLDGRVVWGGYDALYYFGADRSSRRERRPRTEQLLAEHFFTTFPQLQGVRFSHAWAGMIDTCTRFTAFWHRAMGDKVVAVQGYTGLGVGASRFGARVALELLEGLDTPRTQLELVRRRPLPFPPEPARWMGIETTRRALAHADRNDGRRDAWLRLLDRLGLGFDS